MNKIIKELKEALNTNTETKAYDTQAEVVRVEGQTLWVHIPGGVDETPVKKTINAKAGDTVQVRVGGGSAWLVGNQSAPPTDDTTAIIADRRASEVRGIALEAQQSAEMAELKADDAYDLATTAKTSADGKNTIYYGASAPTGGTYKTGDTWFNSSEDNAIYMWNGASWTKEELGEDAIANLSITNAKIANGTIQNGKIANLDAAKITSGNIDANRIKTNVVSAINATANKIDAKNITVDGTLIVGASDVADAIDDINVGGRNLLKNTQILDKWSHSSGITITKDTSEDIYVCNFPEVTSISWRVMQNCPQEVIIPYSLVRNKTVTLSYWFKMDAIPSNDVAGANYAGFALNNAGVYTSQRKLWSGSLVNNKTKSVTTWQKIERTIEVTDSVFTQGTGTITDTDLFYIQFYNHNTVATHLKSFKLEIGNKATDWSPAPEDTDTAIANAVDGINIGGVNFYGYGSDMQTSLSGLYNLSNGFSIVTEDGIKCAHATGALNTTKYLQSKLTFTPKPMETWTFSGDVKIKNIVRGTTNPMCEFYFGGATIDGARRGWSITSWKLDGVETNLKTMGFDWHITDTKWHHVEISAYFNYNGTSTIPAMLANIYLRDATGDLYIHHVKLERGNKATDWNTTETEYITRIDNGGIKVHDAGDTSNYAQVNSDGMKVFKNSTEMASFGSDVRIGKPTSNNTGNVYIDDDSIDIRKGSTVLSTFTANGAEFGKNSDTATIDFCNSKSRISVVNGDTRISSKKGLTIYTYNYDWYTPSQYGTSGTLDLDVTDNGSMFWRTFAERDWGVSSEWGDYPDHFMYPKIGAYGTWYDNENYADIQCPKVWIGTGSSALWHGLYSDQQYDGDSSNALQNWIICVDANKYVRIPRVYDTTTTLAANMYIAVGSNTKGQLYRSTASSKRYKKDIENIEDATALYDIPVRQFKYRDDYLSNEDNRFDKTVPGFIAEEVDKVYPIAVEYADEQPEDWNVRYIVPPMLKLLQEQHKEIEELKAKVEELERR